MLTRSGGARGTRLSAALLIVGGTVGTALADSWPMKHRDMQHTGRASFVMPASRLNDTFFDVVRWQKPSPGSPGEGNFSAGSMVFYDDVGPGGADLVVSGYHWPKGVQGMDRHNGKRLWYGSPPGGEGIGGTTPAFAPSGGVIYVGTDAETPTMAFLPTTGPSSYWSYTGGLLAGGSPVIAPDGRIFRFGWADRVYGGTDSGDAIDLTWSAATWQSPCFSEPALYDYAPGDLRVVSTGRATTLKSYRADDPGGTEAWSVNLGRGTDAGATVDPADGNIYFASPQDGDVWVTGVDRDGGALWGGSPSVRVYDYVAGVNSSQGVAGTGCLSHDGATYYLQTYSSVGDGQLFAIDTGSGTIKWTCSTQGKGSLEGWRSCPIVTPNGVIVVGNNDNMQYYAVQDGGDEGTVLDTLTVEPNTWGGGANATASLSADGLLYLPARLVWVASNGDGDGPSFAPENLYNAFDLNDGATMDLPPPGCQGGIALNHAVKVYWKPILDPTGVFDHYAIYRSMAPFTNVTAMTPVATVAGVNTESYTNSGLTNGVHYHYAVTSVSVGGGEVETVTSHGPRTPANRSDLQIAYLERTPRYPRYLPNYTWWWATEPSGFGPYMTSAATSLGGGQTPATQRWPEPGDPVTYVATVRNSGTNKWIGTVTGVWQRAGEVVATQPQVVSLDPYQTTTYTYTDTWNDQLYDIQFTLNVLDTDAYNNTRTTWTKSAPFMTYLDVGFVENFREISTPAHPLAATDNALDWLQRHADEMNRMFAEAGSLKRVHYGVLETLQDGDDVPPLETTPFGVFPLRYDADVPDGNPRGGYYWPERDIDYGLCHEMSHQLGLIDIYVFNFGGDANRVSSLPYSPPADLMLGCSPLYSPFSAGAMTRWASIVHGYYGQFMYDIPAQVRLRILNFGGQPLPGATVKMYQFCDHPDGRYISTQIKAQGVTDGSGIWTLPNVPIDPGLVPPTDAGVLHDNPFGYVAVIGANAVLHFRIESGDFVDYAWLSLPDVNLAYWAGDTDVATFDRQTIIGGPRQNFPPADIAELNVGNWTGYTQGGTHTLADDAGRKHAGAASIRFDTDGGYDTYVRYPIGLLARWDLSTVQTIRFWVYATNPNGSFQSASPWVRLGNHRDGYFQWTPSWDILNTALNQWHEFVIPIDGDATWTRSTFGNPTLSEINYFELHADTWGGGFTLWLDGVGVAPSPQPTRGDTNCDGAVDFDDINPFVAALVDEDGYYANYPDCAYENADCNADGGVDFDDINPFVALLVQGG